MTTTLQSIRSVLCLAALGSFVNGCDRPPEPSGSQATTPRSSTTAAATAPASSTRKKGGPVRPKRPESGRHDLHVKVDGLQRDYTVYIPVAYNHLTPVPVMLFLQGEEGPLDGPEVDGRKKSLFGGLERGRVIGVFPRPVAKGKDTPGTWHHGLCGDDAGAEGPDEVGYLTAVLLELKRRLVMDSKRIYLVGEGSGAVMAHRAAAAFGSLVAGVAAFGGSVGCLRDGASKENIVPNATGPVSALLVHGRKDERFPYAGGKPKVEGGKTAFAWLSSDRSLAYWSANDKCKGKSAKTDLDGQEGVREELNCANGTAKVVRYALSNQDHRWPTTIAGKPTIKVLLDTFDLMPNRR